MVSEVVADRGHRLGFYSYCYVVVNSGNGTHCGKRRYNGRLHVRSFVPLAWLRRPPAFCIHLSLWRGFDAPGVLYPYMPFWPWYRQPLAIFVSSMWPLGHGLRRLLFIKIASCVFCQNGLLLLVSTASGFFCSSISRVFGMVFQYFVHQNDLLDMVSRASLAFFISMASW